MSPSSAAVDRKNRRAVSWRLATEIFLWRHGWIWAASLAITAVAALLLFQSLPLRAQLEDQRSELAGLAHELAALEDAPGASGRTVHASLATNLPLQAVLPAAAEADSQVRRIYRIAAMHGLELPQSVFQTVNDPRIGITRVQVTSVVTASYPQLRLYIETLLRQMPHVTVDQLTFKREDVSENRIKAELRLSCWLRGART